MPWPFHHEPWRVVAVGVGEWEDYYGHVCGWCSWTLYERGDERKCIGTGDQPYRHRGYVNVIVPWLDGSQYLPAEFCGEHRYQRPQLTVIEGGRA